MTWAPSGPEIYRLRESAPAASPAAAESGLNALATPTRLGAAQAKFLSPENPLTVILVLGALTAGFMAFSTTGSVRVGKTTATAGIGVGSTK